MTEIDIIRGGNIKVGDTLPNLRVQLMEEDEPFNLTNYSISISMRKANKDSKKIDNNSNNIEVESKTRGIVTFKWEENHTDTRGTYLIEIVATEDSGTAEISFPNSGYQQLFIEKRL